jgi:hypothetical protein
MLKILISRYFVRLLILGRNLARNLVTGATCAEFDEREAMTELNNAVIQSVAMVNAMTVGMSPAMAMGSQYQHLAYNIGMAMMNQVFAQQQANISHQAASFVNLIHVYR